MKRAEKERKDENKGLLLLKKVIGKLVRYIYSREEQLLLEAPMRKATSNMSDLGFFGTDSDEDFLEKVKKYFPSRYSLFKKRLSQGLYCYKIYTQEGRLVAYTWVATSDYYEPAFRHTFKLKEKRIYQFDGFIHPDARKGPLASLLTTSFWDTHFDKGFTHSMAAVSRESEGNLKWHAFMRFKETGEKIVIYHFFRFPFTVLQRYDERYLKVRQERKSRDN